MIFKNSDIVKFEQNSIDIFTKRFRFLREVRYLSGGLWNNHLFNFFPNDESEMTRVRDLEGN